MSSKKLINEENLEIAFKALDMKEQGVINIESLKNVFGLDEDGVVSLHEELDIFERDDDGNITLEVFKAAIFKQWDN